MKYSVIHDTIRGGVVCGVLACRSDDQLYCTRFGRCLPAAYYYCNGRDDCGDGVDEPDNCSQPAFYICIVDYEAELKTRDRKPRDWKTQHRTAGLVNVEKGYMESQTVYFTCMLVFNRISDRRASSAIHSVTVT